MVAIIVFMVIVLAGGYAYSSIEGWSYLDSVYFSAVTITTLGYGDFVPVTSLGKIFTIIFSLSGIVIGLYIITMLGKSLFSIEIKKWGNAKVINLKKDKSFNVSKISIGDVISWHPNGKDHMIGSVTEIGLDHVGMHLTKKNGQLVPKREQKPLTITSKGKIKKG